MQFGNPIEGDVNEIEIGGDSDKKSSQSNGESSESPPGNEPKSETESTPTPADSSENSETNESQQPEEIKNRFLMIRVAFDESLLGEKPVAPVAPVAPVKPEGYVEAPETEEKADNDAAPKPPQQGDESGAENENGDQDPADERPQEFKNYDIAKAAYDDAKTKHELDLTRFNDDMKAFNEKIEAANTRVAELNERFGAWFYVISADNLENLQIKKDEVVSAKEVVKPPAGQNLPDRPNLNIGGDSLLPAEPSDDQQPETTGNGGVSEN